MVLGLWYRFMRRLVFLLCSVRYASTAMAKPQVFFDITIGGKPAGRLTLEVSGTPCTACSLQRGVRLCGSSDVHARGCIA